MIVHTAHILHEVVAQPTRQLSNSVLVSHLDVPHPPDGDGLQLLGTHHCPQARAACGSIDVVDHTGITYQFLTRQATLGDAETLVLQLLLQYAIHLQSLLTPDVCRIAQLHLIVLNPQVDWHLRLAGDDNGVPTGAL